MQQSQSHDLMQDYSRAQMEYSKMLLMPYQHHQMAAPNSYQAPMASMHYQQQQVMQPSQMLPSHSPHFTTAGQHSFNRLQQQHPEQLHLHPTNQSVVHKTTKHSLSQHLSRCHIHPVHRQLNNSQTAYQTDARVRQLNSYLGAQQQQHLASPIQHQTPAPTIPEANPGALSYAGSEPELRIQYQLSPRQRVASVSAGLPSSSTGSPVQQQQQQLQPLHTPCPAPALNSIPQTAAASPQVVLQHNSLARATSAPQAQPNSYQTGLSPKTNTSASDSLSPNGALSLGINLEQYISKRNERERSRVKNVNDAFDNLKCSLPLDSDKASKRISKVEILRTAISYIRNLESMLSEQPTTSEPANKKSPEEALTSAHSPNTQNNAASIKNMETNPTGSQIYLAYQQLEQQQHPTATQTATTNAVHTQLTSEQDYLDLMNSLDFQDGQLDY